MNPAYIPKKTERFSPLWALCLCVLFVCLLALLMEPTILKQMDRRVGTPPNIAQAQPPECAFYKWGCPLPGLTGTNNVAIGYQALQNITTGTNNVAIGYQALQNITTDDSNAFGKDAMRKTARRSRRKVQQ